MPTKAKPIIAHKKFKVTAAASIKGADAPKGSKKPPRFSCVAYTGAAMDLDGFDVPLIIDLAGMTFHSQARPALLDHCPDKDNVVGQTDAIRITGKQLEVDGFILRSTPASRDVLAAAIEGFTWQMSVGCDIPTEADIESISAGDTVEVNGQSFPGPCAVARKTILGEVSFVVMGADGRTWSIITARRKAQLKARKQTMTFEEWLKSLMLDGITLNDEQRAALQKTYDELYPAEPAPDAEADDEDVDAEADDEDVDAEADDEDVPAKAKAKASAKGKTKPTVFKSITAARARAHRMVAAIEKAAKGDSALTATALEKGWDAGRVATEVKLKQLQAGRAKAPGADGGSPLTINAKVMEAALLMNIGTNEKSVGKHFDEKTMNVACSHAWRGCSLHVLMDQVIEAAGERFSGSRKTDAFIRAAASANRKIQASGGYSSVSLSQILENVANKSLIDSYDAVETVWQHFCAIRPMNDFKIHSYYRLDMEGAFKKVGPSGELQHLKPTDAKYTNQLETYGAQLVLTRQMQINDDLNAFVMLPKAIGRLAKLRPEEAWIVLLLGNASNFFHANNRNKLTGAGSALGIPGLTAAKTQYKKQVDSNKKPILVTPDRILTGATLSVTAENLNVEQTLVGGTTNDKINRNPHKGKYAPYDTPYVDNTAITDQDGAAISGQSDTVWFLGCDPNVRAAYAMGFLNGNQTPFFRAKEADTGILGTAYESFMDFGVGEEDPYCMQMNVGQ